MWGGGVLKVNCPLCMVANVCEIHVKCFFSTKSYGVKAQGSDSVLSILKGKSVCRNENDKCVWTYSLTGEYF